MRDVQRPRPALGILVFWLFGIIVDLIGEVIDRARGTIIVGALITIVLLLPTIAVSVRRLHDIDRSGWWYLLVLIPIIGWIVLLVWYCTRGTVGPNRYGSDPLAGATSGTSPAA